jgi:hypothetical protein
MTIRQRVLVVAAAGALVGVGVWMTYRATPRPRVIGSASGEHRGKYRSPGFDVLVYTGSGLSQERMLVISPPLGRRRAPVCCTTTSRSGSWIG